MRRRIMLVDRLANEDSYCNFMEEHLGVDFDLSFCRTKAEFYENIVSFAPDFVYVNMMSTKDMDPLALLHDIGNINGPTAIIIGTDPDDTYYIRQIYALNVICVMVAPFSIEELGRQLCEIATFAIPFGGVYSINTLDSILIRLGFKCSVQKYECFQYAVDLRLKNPAMAVMKELYPALAKKVNGTAGSVEKSFRDAIRCAREVGEPGLWSAFFPYLKKHETLSNDEFLNRVTLAVMRNERPHISMEEFLSKKKSTF